MIDEISINLRISQIQAAIVELEAEKRALQSMLYNSVAAKRAGDIKSKRSIRRIFNEEKIKQIIGESKNRAKTSLIHFRLLRIGVNIKEPTLRSYLSRMHKIGQIQLNKSSREWSVTWPES